MAKGIALNAQRSASKGTGNFMAKPPITEWFYGATLMRKRTYGVPNGDRV
jgi:hypothetical protein